MPTKVHPAVALLRSAKKPLKASDFLERAISRMTLHRLVERGDIERVSNGVYRLPEFTSVYADWAALSVRYPRSVICTQSAATFHGTTQDLAGEIHVMLPHDDFGRSVLASTFPVATRVIRLRSSKAFDPLSYGIEEHIIDGIQVRITDLERTAVDMFRFSAFNPSLKPEQVHVSEESFLVCLERTISRRDFSIDQMTAYAERAGVMKSMTPLLKTSLHIVSNLPADHYETTSRQSR